MRRHVRDSRQLTTSRLSEEFGYSVVGGAPPYIQAPVLSLITVGIPTTSVLTESPTAQWLDYGSSWSISNPLAGSTSSERWFAPSGTSGVASAGDEQTTAYQNQYSVLIAASPAACGSTTPSGPNWENSGDNFQFTTSAGQGCTFSAWEVTGLVAVFQPGHLSTTAFAYSNGTLTASFSRSIVPTFPTSTLILIIGGGATGVAVGALFMRSRRLRSRVPGQ